MGTGAISITCLHSVGWSVRDTNNIHPDRGEHTENTMHILVKTYIKLGTE